jgi:hypothetical protein
VLFFPSQHASLCLAFQKLHVRHNFADDNRRNFLKLQL